MARKQYGQRFFFLNLFYSLQRGPMFFLLQRKLYFSKDSERVHIFQGGGGGGATFSGGGGGPNAYFCRNPYNL